MFSGISTSLGWGRWGGQALEVVIHLQTELTLWGEQLPLNSSLVPDKREKDRSRTWSGRGAADWIWTRCHKGHLFHITKTWLTLAVSSVVEYIQFLGLQSYRSQVKLRPWNTSSNHPSWRHARFCRPLFPDIPTHFGPILIKLWFDYFLIGSS